MTLEPNWNSRPNSMGFVPRGPEGKTRIICAAIKHKDGTIFCASRHGSPAMVQQLRVSDKKFMDCEEGFIDQFDRFWNRGEALEIIRSTGQEIKTFDGAERELFSENLY